MYSYLTEESDSRLAGRAMQVDTYQSVHLLELHDEAIMFEIPDAKRICRSDLYTISRSASPSSDSSANEDAESKRVDKEAIAERLRRRFEEIYGKIGGGDESVSGGASQVEVRIRGPETSIPGQNDDEDEDEDDTEDIAEKEEVGQEKPPEEFSFRLFSRPSAKTNQASTDVQVQKVTLEPVESAQGEYGGIQGGFVRQRDPRIWIVPRATGERLSQYCSVAMSGEAVLRGRQDRNWGLEVPWRLQIIREVGKRKFPHSVAREERDEIRKTKPQPGKKARILSRRRQKVLREEEEKRKLADLGKEERAKEKKIRRNREKKLKKRAKEKALKASGGVDAGDVVGEAGGEGDGSD